ncbi:uncharacterized protein KZ484_024098 [Pholidichthys leucotaenia]
MEGWIGLFFLLTLIISLHAEEEKKILSVTKGGKITVPDSVLEKGFLLYGGNNIAQVFEGKFIILEEIYTSRLHWNKTSGLFTLTDMQRNDSGIYIIDSKKPRFSSSYKVTVYEPVAAPRVVRSRVTSDLCSFICSVDKEATLLWYRDKKILNQSRSVNLTLTVDRKDLSSSYRCVSTNPAENRIVDADIKKLCEESNIESRDHKTRTYLLVSIPILPVVIVIFAAILIPGRQWSSKIKRTIKQAQDSANKVSEVFYCEVKFPNRQAPQGDKNSTRPIHHPDLTTVYYKLQPDRNTGPDDV